MRIDIFKLRRVKNWTIAIVLFWAFVVGFFMLSVNRGLERGTVTTTPTRTVSEQPERTVRTPGTPSETARQETAPQERQVAQGNKFNAEFYLKTTTPDKYWNVYLQRWNFETKQAEDLVWLFGPAQYLIGERERVGADLLKERLTKFSKLELSGSQKPIEIYPNNYDGFLFAIEKTVLEDPKMVDIIANYLIPFLERNSKREDIIKWPYRALYVVSYIETQMTVHVRTVARNDEGVPEEISTELVKAYRRSSN